MRHPLFSSALVALVLLAAGPAGAQPAPCEDVLAEAERLYLEQEYGSVEPYVVECVYRPGVTTGQLQDAYRLLALSYIKQDLLADAQVTIVKLFGVDYAYEPDPVTDPPFYVALVSAVKDQLRVDADAAASGPDSAEVRPTLDGPPVETETEVYEPVTVSPSPAARVDLNTATAAELESLSGIGPALAQRILDYRTDAGPFDRPEDLQNVRGIGPRTLESLLPFIAAGDGPPPPTITDPVVTVASAAPASGRIDLNTATAAELDALHGIGPALARRIVASREEEGPFRSVDEVTRVRGIGPAKLEGFRDQATVGE